jgi:hypothetical protein
VRRNAFRGIFKKPGMVLAAHMSGGGSGLAFYTLIAYKPHMEERIRNTIVETESFIKQATALWSESELEALKYHLALNPLAGDEIPDTGGVRKIRWSRAGMGKRGGARVIYYYYDESAPLFLLWAYAKAKRQDLTPAEKLTVTKAAEFLKMSIKAKRKRG